MTPRRHFTHCVSCLAALTVLAGCGNVPQPFRRTSDQRNPLLANPSGAGIGILPPIGLEGRAGHYVAQRMAATLKQQEIPAEAVDRAGVLGFTVEGNLRDTRYQDGTVQVSFDWRLLNRLGEIIERLPQEVQVRALDWNSRNDLALNTLADDMSAQLILLLAPPVVATPTEPKAQPWDGLSVTIQRPESAPGDGAQALGRALANRLLKEGFKPPEDEPDFIVSISVMLSPYDATQDDVSIVWTILSPDGNDLGEVGLDNRIPRGQLDGDWGPIAEAIVESAFPGLLQIVTSQVVPRR